MRRTKCAVHIVRKVAEFESRLARVRASATTTLTFGSRGRATRATRERRAVVKVMELSASKNSRRGPAARTRGGSF